MTAWLTAVCAATLTAASCHGDARDRVPSPAPTCDPAPVAGPGPAVARFEAGVAVSRALFGEVSSAPDGARRVELAVTAEGSVVRLVAESQHSAMLPAALACRALALRVDGRVFAQGDVTARVVDMESARREHLDVALGADAVAAMRGARCVSVAVCDAVFPLRAEQVAVLRQLAARVR